MIQKVGSDGDYIFHLFVRPKDARAEQWDGARSGEQAALDVFNADEVGQSEALVIGRILTAYRPVTSIASQRYSLH